MCRILPTTWVAAVIALTASAACEGPEPPAPTLVVNMAVDQLRPDLLYHYDPLFTGGLRRLLDHGLHHPDGTHDHAYTGTAVGHTTLGTGVYPTRSGIVGNTWNEEVAPGEWRSVYAVEDALSPIVGVPEAVGRSPASLYREGLANWVLEHSPESRVVSIAGKDRAAIPMAATAPGEVYWMLRGGGRFVTSTWYRDAYPEWVTRFHEEQFPHVYADTIWESSIPPEAEPFLRRADESPYEADGVHTTFPHHASREASGGREGYDLWREATPALDRATLALTMEAIRELELGQRGVVDYLGVGLVSTDYVGHRYGPWSHEQLDNLLSLDRELAIFFDFLDETVGEGRWILGFSADHGIAEIPETTEELGLPPGRRLTVVEERGAARQAAEVAAGEGDSEDAQIRAAAFLEGLDWVEVAMPLHLIEQGVPSDSFGDLFRNSYSGTRITGPFYQSRVIVRYTEGTIRPLARGTTHTTAYHYDRWVPLSFMGAGVEPGLSDARAATVDMAPTLAALAGIPVPPDLDGRALLSPGRLE